MAMTEELTIGSSPTDEDGISVGQANYAGKAQLECRCFVKMLRRVFGPEPEGARLVVKGQPHDYGTYYEVFCRYDPFVTAAVDYAYRCEGQTPDKWDSLALEELGIHHKAEETPLRGPNDGKDFSALPRLCFADVIAAKSKRHMEREERQWAESLDMAELESMIMGDGDCITMDGCSVEPDGRCCHGYRSPLLLLGMI